MPSQTKRLKNAFTIVELMVVVAIIALLVSIMIPGFAAVRKSAKETATRALFQSLRAGLESYRGERALGGKYPPSRSDNPDGPSMNNPFSDSRTEVDIIMGANLLTYAMVGADQLGTPGFPDIKNGGTFDGKWWNDQGADQTAEYKAAYALDKTTKEPFRTRYPGNGATYVDETTRETVRSYQQMFDDGRILGDPKDEGVLGLGDQLTFTDKWGMPVLYYRANRAGRIMVTNPKAGGRLGIYDSRDNSFFTGYDPKNILGADFGPAKLDRRHRSRLSHTEAPILKPELQGGENKILVDDTRYEFALERFILDRSVTAQNRPVNAQSYLLISAGNDAIFGTSDDITNWERPTE